MRGARAGLVALLAGAAVLVLVLVVGVRPSPAQKSADEKGVAIAPKTPTKLYYGVATCRICHTKPIEAQQPILCPCDEVVTWEKQDKHGNAWKVLLEDRAQRMGKLLGYDVTVSPKCVNCHGLLDDPKYTIDPTSKKPTTFKKDEGVNCCVCHGTYKEWIFAHYDPSVGENAAWRSIKGDGKLTSREVKQRDYGMLDLWDPVKRAKLCFSCHVGNTEEGKVVTHDMYAAGHPPLPSIEIGTFSEEMPRHWKYPGEKSEAVRKLQDFTPVQANFERTQLVLLGGLATLRESVNLAVTQAEKGDLDFAVFDCYACHHELKSKSWRVERGYRGRPGRPQMPEWPAALARANLLALGYPTNALEDALTPLYRAFDKRPFGDPKSVAEEGKKVVDTIDKWILAARKSPLDQKLARKLLEELSQFPAKDLPDYDSARQLAWGSVMVGLEARGWKPRKGYDGYKELKMTKAYGELDKVLKLSLPATRAKELEKDLPYALEMRAGYDPATFKSAFRKLVDELGKPAGGSK